MIIGFETLIIVFVLAVIFAIGAMESKRRGKKMSEESFVVRVPRIWILATTLSTLGFCVLLYMMAVLYHGDTDDLWIYIFFSLCIVVGFLLSVYLMTWKLVVEGDLIVYTPFLGIRREIKISEITRARITGLGELRAYTGKKRLFIVGLTSSGADMLISRLESEEHIQFK